MILPSARAARADDAAPSFILRAVLCLLFTAVSGFAPIPHRTLSKSAGYSVPPAAVAAFRRMVGASSRPAGDWSGAVALFESRLDVTTTSPDEAASMGARDWPQQLKRGSWAEEVPPGTTVVRYILDGTGTVEATTMAGGDTDETSSTIKSQVGPGSLVEATGEAYLSWVADGDGMTILTPGFEEGGKLLAVAAALLVLCWALIAGVGGN